MIVPCCFTLFGCIELEDVDCIAQGGQVVASCDPIDCDEEPSLPTQDGCFTQVVFPTIPGAEYHTTDLCEHTTMQATRITDVVDPDRWTAVSAHKSRMTSRGCEYNESFIMIDNGGVARFVGCTRRNADQGHYTLGQVFIEKEEVDPFSLESLPIPVGAAGVIFGTESPFYYETNLSAYPNVCVPPFS